MGTVTGTGAFRLVLLDELAVLALCRKSVSAPSDWVEPGVGETLASWVAPLSPIDATPAGSIALKLLVPHQRRHQFDGFRALLVGYHDKRTWHLGRLEFQPLGLPPHHHNPTAAMRFEGIDAELDGPHVHSFCDNRLLPMAEEAFSPDKNLPVARRIDWNGTFRGALSIVEEQFGIEGLWIEEDLPWDRTLF
jgi:hypothetical protein